MNARHAYDLFRVKYPVFIASSHEWQVLARGDASDRDRIENFLRQSFSADEVVVCVSRKIGGLMSIEDASHVIAAALGTAQVKLANRAMTEFAVIGHPGVGAAWSELNA